MANEFKELFSLTGAAWSGIVILGLVVVRIWSGLPQVLDKWLAYRTARAAEKVSDWKRIRDEVQRLHEWCAQLQQEVNECHEQKNEWMSRAIAAEAQQIGRGEARQELTILEGRRQIKEKDKK